MSFRARSRRYRRGQTLIEIVLAVSLMGFAVMAMLGGLSVVGRVSDRVTEASETVASVDALADQLESSASSAAAVYSPPLGANMTGLMFLQFDNSGTRHRWGYTYNSSTKTLTKCTQYSPLATSDYDTTCTGVSSTRPIASFTVNQLSMTAQAAAFGLTAQNDVAVEMDAVTRDPSGIVVAGNAINEISISQGTTARTIDLIQGGVPLSVGVIAHHNQAPAVGAITGPGSESVTTGGIVEAGFTEANYGAYAPYLGAMGGWLVTACSGGSGGTAGIAVTGNSGNTSTIAITGATVGTCTFDVVTEGQTFPVTVTIMPLPTPMPTASPIPSPTPSPAITTSPTPTPTGSNTPDPCDPERQTCSTPSPSPTPRTACATNYGTPTFVEPAQKTNQDSPSFEEMYAAVSAAGSNSSNTRTPNGNTMYGFWDHYSGGDGGGAKGSILFTENTDCSVTMIMGTLSSSDGPDPGLFEMSVVFNVPDNYDMFSYSPTPVTGCGNVVGTCSGPTVQPGGTIYQPISLSADGGGTTAFNIQYNNEDIEPGFNNPSVCDNANEGGSYADFDKGTHYKETQLSAQTYSLDTVGVNFNGNSNYSLARVVMQPYDAIQYIPRPGFAHVVRTNFHAVCYFDEGSGFFGTGPTASALGPGQPIGGGGAPTSASSGLLLSGYVAGGHGATSP